MIEQNVMYRKQDKKNQRKKVIDTPFELSMQSKNINIDNINNKLEGKKSFTKMKASMAGGAEDSSK